MKCKYCGRKLTGHWNLKYCKDVPGCRNYQYSTSKHRYFKKNPELYAKYYEEHNRKLLRYIELLPPKFQGGSSSYIERYKDPFISLIRKKKIKHDHSYLRINGKSNPHKTIRTLTPKQEEQASKLKYIPFKVDPGTYTPFKIDDIID